MKFAENRPVKIVMLGAGGTGGHIAPHLYRLLYALERPVRFIICDGDIVEEKNLVRQNFTPADLGENKAKVLAERYSSVFGMETEYVPEFIESGERLLSMLRARTFPTGPYWHSPTVKELVILIGAVDNNKSRKLCHEVFYKLDDLIYIDSGNGMHTGQIVCGIRSGGRTFYRPVGAAFPEVLQDTDKFPTELSCAEASVSAPQSIATQAMQTGRMLSLTSKNRALPNTTVCRTVSSRKNAAMTRIENAASNTSVYWPTRKIPTAAQTLPNRVNSSPSRYLQPTTCPGVTGMVRA